MLFERKERAKVSIKKWEREEESRVDVVLTNLRERSG